MQEGWDTSSSQATTANKATFAPRPVRPGSLDLKRLYFSFRQEQRAKGPGIS